MIITEHIVFIYNLHFRIRYFWCQYFIMEEWDMLSFCLMEINSDLILPRSWIFNTLEQYADIPPVCCSCRSFVPVQRCSPDRAENRKDAALNFQWGDSTLSFSSVTIIGSVTQWNNMPHPPINEEFSKWCTAPVNCQSFCLFTEWSSISRRKNTLKQHTSTVCCKLISSVFL